MAAVKFEMGPIATYGPGPLLGGVLIDAPPMAQRSVMLLLIVVWSLLTFMLYGRVSVGKVSCSVLFLSLDRSMDDISVLGVSKQRVLMS